MRCAIALAVFLLAAPTASAGVPWHLVPGGRGLSTKDKARAARLLQSTTCYYGCSASVADCLAKGTGTARFLAEMIVRYVKQDRTDAFIRREVLARARTMHPFRKKKVRYRRDHCTGDASRAKVVIAAFGDFQCPFCTVILPMVKRVVRGYGSKVVFCFKHFPTQAHGKHAVTSARAAVVAAAPGKFWAMFDILYKHRRHQSVQEVEQYAKRIGLELDRFRRDRDSRKTLRLVVLDKREGLKLGVKGTPTLFLNGKMYHGRKDEAEIRSRIQEELMLVAGGR